MAVEILLLLTLTPLTEPLLLLEAGEGTGVFGGEPVLESEAFETLAGTNGGGRRFWGDWGGGTVGRGGGGPLNFILLLSKPLGMICDGLGGSVLGSSGGLGLMDWDPGGFGWEGFSMEAYSASLEVWGKGSLSRPLKGEDKELLDLLLKTSSSSKSQILSSKSTFGFPGRGSLV